MSFAIFIILSLVLLITSIYLFKKSTSSKINVWTFSILTFISVIFYLLHYIFYYFTGEGLNEAVIYHLNAGLDGAGFFDYWKLIVLSIVFVVAALFLSRWILIKKFKHQPKKTVYIYVAFALIILSLIFNPLTISLYDVLRPSLDNTDFYKFYRQPYIEQIGESKNLVVIYGEGLERTYFNETIFPDLITELRELESRSTYFTRIFQIVDSYTISGLVASQCGIKLVAPSHGNSLSGVNEYLPLADCLGDLLHKEGYYLAFYQGADLNFQGKDKFHKTHNFDEIKGRNELLFKLDDQGYRTGWGLYDDSLFDLTFDRFIELSEEHDKFALFIQTLDTHHPNGNPSRSCQEIQYADGSNPILNAVACSDYLISDLTNKITQSAYGNKTVVVIVSDHIAPRNSASDLLKKANRGNLFMIIEPYKNSSNEIKNPGSTMDVGVTILSFIGYKGEIGLGRDLMNANYSWHDFFSILQNVSSWKKEVLNFWNFPIINEKVKINLNNQTINIDNQTFKIPVLVELNSKFETTLKFQFYLPENKSLVESVKRLNNTSFFLIDECKNTNKLGGIFKVRPYCLVYGKGQDYTVSDIFSNSVFTRNEIKKMTRLS